MEFETKVMKIVEDVLGKDEFNGVVYGSLFVNCFPEDATKLLKRLKKDFDGKVQMNKLFNMEYAFDFVA